MILHFSRIYNRFIRRDFCQTVVFLYTQEDTLNCFSDLVHFHFRHGKTLTSFSFTSTMFSPNVQPFANGIIRGRILPKFRIGLLLAAILQMLTPGGQRYNAMADGTKQNFSVSLSILAKIIGMCLMHVP